MAYAGRIVLNIEIIRETAQSSVAAIAATAPAVAKNRSIGLTGLI